MTKIIGQGKFNKLKLINNDDPDQVVEEQFRRLEYLLLTEDQDDQGVVNSLNSLRNSYFWWLSKKEK